jgi:predicted esterase
LPLYRYGFVDEFSDHYYSNWIFHGLLDDVVNVDYSIAIYKKLKACNADVELTILMMLMIAGRVYDNQRDLMDV